jgi:hypothetical protein
LRGRRRSPPFKPREPLLDALHADMPTSVSPAADRGPSSLR